MTIFQIMFSIIATILIGVMAFIIFILVEHKEELWEELNNVNFNSVESHRIKINEVGEKCLRKN